MQGRASRYGPTASSQQLSNTTSLSPTPSGTGEKERFGQDANMWDAGFDGMNPEADDYLHNPDPKRDRKVYIFSFMSSTRTDISGNRNDIHMARSHEHRLFIHPTPRCPLSIRRLPNHLLLYRKLAQDGRSIQPRRNQWNWSSSFNLEFPKFDRYRYA